MPTPAQLVAKLPLSPALIFESDRGLHEHGFVVHGTLVDAERNVKAYLRENYNGAFHEGLIALKSLQDHGVEVAKHLPFIAPDSMKMLLVEKVEGPNMNKSTAEPDVFFKLAIKLGRYTAKSLRKQERVLTDIYDPFQYILRDDLPVLVDLDMHLHEAATEPKKIRALSAHVFEELLEGYEAFLPKPQMDELNTSIIDYHHSVLASL